VVDEWYARANLAGSLVDEWYARVRSEIGDVEKTAE
jgi:hypothetical protein